MNEFDDNLRRVDILMFAKLIRRGWATLPPHKVVMFVLSEDRIVPRRVAPLGSCNYTGVKVKHCH